MDNVLWFFGWCKSCCHRYFAQKVPQLTKKRKALNVNDVQSQMKFQRLGQKFQGLEFKFQALEFKFQALEF